MAKDKSLAETSTAVASGSNATLAVSTNTSDAHILSPANAAAMAQQDLVLSNGIENYELPKSLVTRISKSVLPDNAKLQKDTVLALVKGSTVFINYLAATAHDIATSRQHRSVSASDVIKALEIIQFGDIVPGLQEELEVFRANARSSRKSKSGDSKSKGKSKASTASAVAAVTLAKPIGVPIEALTTSNQSDTPLTMDADEDMTPADDLDDQLAGDFSAYNEVSTNGIRTIDVDAQSIPADEEEEDELLSDAADEEDEREVAEEEVDEIIDDEDDELDDEDRIPLDDPMQTEEDELRRDNIGLEADEDEDEE